MTDGGGSNPRNVCLALTAAIFSGWLLIGGTVGHCASNGVDLPDTRISEAVISGAFDQALDLIAGGADVNAKDESSNTPLYYAASYPKALIVVVALIRRGADPNIPCKGGFTPLLQACLRKNLDVADYLVSHKANVNANDKDGVTPLHLAAEFGGLNRMKLVTLLLDNGADPLAKDRDGVTPVDVAKRMKLDAIVTVLTEKARKTTQPAHQE